MHRSWGRFSLCALSMLIVLTAALRSIAESEVPPSDSSEAWSIHFQYTGIAQYHGNFPAQYSGENSLSNSPESPFSVTSTLFLGRRLWDGGELYADPEMSGGSGFSATRGIAGFPNGEVYRVDDMKPNVFLARAFLRQVFALSPAHRESLPPDQNQLASSVPSQRLTLTIGKFSLTDLFDDNAYSHDPRTQFMNWAVWAAGAWDYAADTKGYTWGIAAQATLEHFWLTCALVQVPSTANGPGFDMNLEKAYGLNLEIVRSFNLLESEGRVHLIGFLNRADMGRYQSALDQAASSGQQLDVTTTRSYTSKYGFALGIEQPLGEWSGLFARLSWNDGATETWAFTEIDRSLLLGLSIRPGFWNRPDDNFGVALAASGLSRDHRNYLAAGGYGFMIGDGALSYGLEQIAECFYNARLTGSFWLSIDNQVIVNPAFNRDRGPVEIFAVRGHIEF